MTPNPDVLCNATIKFDAFYKHVRELGFDWVATGHYARVAHAPAPSLPLPLPLPPLARERRGDPPCVLMEAADSGKDQTYFLAGTPSSTLEHVLFPLGDMLKRDVKALAASLGFPELSAQKESMGMCFVGKRKFAQFMSSYTNRELACTFVDVDTGAAVGASSTGLLLTLGQGARVPGVPEPYFVVGKDVDTHRVFVVSGSTNPLLFSHEFGVGALTLSSSHLTPIAAQAGGPASDDSGPGEGSVLVRVRHRAQLVACRVVDAATAAATLQCQGHHATSPSPPHPHPHPHHTMGTGHSFGSTPDRKGGLAQWRHDSCKQNERARLQCTVQCDAAIRGVTPGQFAVFYQHGVCLGRAEITCVRQNTGPL